MKIGVTLLAVIVTGFVVCDAHACGDTLYRVGKGLTYRLYTAPLPGNVLVYGGSAGAQQLADALAQAGHGVRLVSTSEELKSELEKGDYDVVIAAYSDHEAVESLTSESVAAGTTYLPVAQSDEEESLASQSYERVMSAERDEIKNYLKAIHRALKLRT